MFALRIRTLTGTHLGRCLKDLGIQNKLISSTACCHQDFSPGPQQPIVEGGMSSAVSARPLPLMTSRKLLFPNHYREPQQAWLESLGQMEDEKLGVVDLHPDVFGTMPRLDVLHYNVKWQQMYKKINYDNAPTRAEMRGGGRKPWPQKGTGRARHGSIRSPLWLKGGKAHGPRGPKSYYYMLTQDYRALGLRVALSTKYAQDNLHIVDSLDLPTDEPEYLQDLVESRNWGLSALFIDDTDLVSRNIAIASSGINHFNIMPVYGLNVHSMLKHECLVLTLAAVERIEERLLSFMHKLDRKPKSWKEQTTRL